MGAFNTGSVGSCKIFNCAASRGPTHCSWGSCYCNEGFCRYPVTTLHVQSRTCRQRAGDTTCHTSRVCYSAGLSETSCSGGLCFCKMGMTYNCDTQACEYGANFLANMTTAEISEMEKISHQETMEQLFVVGLWACTAFVLMIGGGLVVRSRLRSPKVEEEKGYAVLEDSQTC